MDVLISPTVSFFNHNEVDKSILNHIAHICVSTKYFFSCVYDCIEDTATFTILMKNNSMKHSCNTKLANKNAYQPHLATQARVLSRSKDM